MQQQQQQRQNNRQHIIHYNNDNIVSNMMELGFTFFELTGYSLITFYDVVVAFPDQFNRYIRRRNGIFQRISMSLRRSWSTPKLSNSSKYYNSSSTSTGSIINDTAYSFNIPVSSSTPSIPTTTATSTPTVVLSPPTSTSTTTTTTTTVGAPGTEKVKNLENELSRLREEIARIMSTTNSGMAPAAAAAPGKACPPPPPPPLPPMYKPTNFKMQKTAEGVIRSSQMPAGTPTKQALSIGDLLRSGQKVTLKKSDIIRSPGGTPVRDITNQQKSVLSTQDFIAVALKNKFKNVVHQESPERRPSTKSATKKGNDDSFFSDSDNEFDAFDDKENRTMVI
ncbi:hypothetical protein SAMD00019534_053690 [Acytostelium subglobosum LB1]|uniref:hypothetical protein n=1 Tax=Acytostelium subglobosum LB1 TaxID=1410327 RepID=UPI00064490D0|nr:hypothetical protein SAMD00019534_053690 [Acytostelium subglobosum LB1]GAM22194.1 hypothetical protein SAMD00019534_053690 [Acytostelium subglobosum LB1]|eukprot:XP_012755294.1 hypothetical protein SAMD00019534_053690 [Acytostelium subglobosum LB1]